MSSRNHVESKAGALPNEGVATYSLLAFLIGIVMLGGSVFVKARYPQFDIPVEIVRELAVALISVFGISFLYEKLSAERAFHRFFFDLQKLIRAGESNAAVCAELGILEIHANRKSYEERHHFAADVANLGPGDSVHVSGRSLIFTMYSWRNFEAMLTKGARLELCLYNPAIVDSPLTLLAGYSHHETRLAVHRFVQSMRPWLLAEPRRGSLEIRFHSIHLLDSFVEIHHGGETRAAWDLNFGEGVESRHILVLDTTRDLGRNLAQERYGCIWQHGEPVFRFDDGKIVLDKLSAADEISAGSLPQ